APSRSRLSREIVLGGISVGQAAVHSPILVQLPNPSASCWATMSSGRLCRSGWPWGNDPSWVIFAAADSVAAAFGHPATHAPHPMHVAASNAWSALSLLTGMLLASGAAPVGALT